LCNESVKHAYFADRGDSPSEWRANGREKFLAVEWFGQEGVDSIIGPSFCRL
jgi:hypothetical protein